jgi:hypothetical protein
MTDVTEAPTQDSIADSLMELMGEPELQETVDQTGTEQQDLEQTDELTQGDEVEQSEEQADDWLPTEQEKVFPDDVLLRYAERYQKDEQWLSDPLNRQLLIDKLNSDILIQQQHAEGEEEFQAEPEPEAEPTRQETQLTREQWFQQLDQMVQQTTDPEVAKAFHGDFLRAFGVPEAEIAKIPAQQAMQFTSVASKYMLNLISTHLPNLLQAQLGNQLSQAFPGFGEMYERSSYAMAWDRVRNENPQFASLPAFGTKEFSKTLRTAAAKIEGFDEIQFTGRDGKPLSPMENAIRKYSMLAQVATNQNVDLNQLRQAAAQAGGRNARRAQVRRSTGNLGSGQSTAATGRTSSSSKFQSNQDLFDDDTMNLYHREHGRL